MYRVEAIVFSLCHVNLYTFYYYYYYYYYYTTTSRKKNIGRIAG